MFSFCLRSGWLLRRAICPVLKPPPPPPPSPEEPYLLPPPPADPAALAAALFSFVELPQRWCRRLVLLGGQTFSHRSRNVSAIDGNKLVCLDEPLRPPCLVYSFGSRDEWSFESDVIRRLGCEVHTFDPSLTGAAAPRHTHGAQFHALGLGGAARVTSRGWRLATLRDIRVQLGHLTHLIAYLKVDIEGGEWEWLEEVGQLQDVLQIGMEVHLPKPMTPAALRRVYSAFRRLQQAGFRTVFSAVNPVFGRDSRVDGLKESVGRYYELVWVRVQF